MNMQVAQAHQLSQGEVLLAEIEGIDLSMVKLKLMDADEGQAWSSDFAEAVEQQYKRYLYMVQISREFSPVPTREIDLFWHQHILDTRAYFSDCQRVFGEFIHHYPYFGMKDAEEAAELEDSFEATKHLYKSLFGEEYGLISIRAGKCHKPGTSSCHKCNSRPKPGPDTIKCKRCKSSR